jgi:predicted O-methyltransferase YrrM
MNDGSGLESASSQLLDAVLQRGLGVAMVLINDTVRLGQIEFALELTRAAKGRYGADYGLLLVETMLLSRLHQGDAAKDCLRRAKDEDAECLVTWMYDAMLDIESRQFGQAREKLRSIIARCPDYPGVAGTLSSLLMPGPNYREVLRTLHQLLRPRSYLEIGVETGATLALAQAQRIIGIDPDLSPLRREKLANHAELHECTSQQFFARHRARDVLGAVPLDLVFIDGLHRYAAAIEDFAAVERWSHPDTVIVMHDALPIAPVYASAERSTRFWVGDVWKATALLLRHRPELRIRVIATAPSGLVIVRLHTAQSPVRADWYRSLLDETRFAPLSETEPVWPAEFPLVGNDLAGYREALGI